MDQQKLRTLVFEKTGVKIDIDDPVFALVALNEAVLEEAVSRHIALIDSASQELVRHARSAGGLAPHTPAARLKSTLLDATNEALDHEAASNDATPASAAGTTPPGATVRSAAPASSAAGAATDISITPRLLAVAGASAVLSALLVLAGQALFFKPVAAPAPIVQQAKQLTAAQILALDRADKLDKAILKLDPKTRAQLQTELAR